MPVVVVVREKERKEGRDHEVAWSMNSWAYPRRESCWRRGRERRRPDADPRRGVERS